MDPHPTDTIEIPTPDGAAVRADLYLPEDPPYTGVVFLCHGFKGYKTWGFFPYLAGRLREIGTAACAVDFSYNGTFPEGSAQQRPPVVSTTVAGAPSPPEVAPMPPVPPRRTRYPRAELFRINTLEREIEDLALALRAVARDGLGGRVDRTASLGLFGHSRGGVSVILNALANERVRVLCTWSTPDHPDHFTARQKAVWRRHGEFDFTDAIDGTRLSLSVAYLDDLEKNHELYDLRRRTKRLPVPHLIVHGDMDLAVPVRCAYSIHEAEGGLLDKRLVVLRTGHTFGVADPPGIDIDDPPHALVEACDVTVEWFRTHLEKGI